jgi:prevent-host-death family protein
MKFISVRDLRGKSAEVWRELHSERELVITSNGKPIAILSATDEAHFEQSLRQLRQARAVHALKQLQERSVAMGRAKMDEGAIDAEIAAARQALRGLRGRRGLRGQR